MTFLFRRAAILLLVPMLAVALGCSSHDSLHGKVTYNGEPVEKGSIDFLATDGQGSGFSVQVHDGAYDYKDPRLGEHVAVIRGLQAFTFSSKEDFIRQQEQMNNPHNLPVDYIPEDAPGNSQSVEIVGGKQIIDFALQGPPRSG